jgi:hypothetical protein
MNPQERYEHAMRTFYAGNGSFICFGDGDIQYWCSDGDVFVMNTATHRIVKRMDWFAWQAQRRAA